jgi:hypothetical protein
MATRNLTKKFVDIRNGEISKRGGKRTKDRDGSETSNPLLEGANMSPAWMEKIALTENIITMIQKKSEISHNFYF